LEPPHGKLNPPPSFLPKETGVQFTMGFKIPYDTGNTSIVIFTILVLQYWYYQYYNIYNTGNTSIVNITILVIPVLLYCTILEIPVL
jgi:hypothetical protein